MSVEKHYTGQQVAELLGLDYETVLHLAQIGEIQTVRSGRRRLYPESAVNQYLDRHREQPQVVADLTSRLRSSKRRKEP